MSAIVDLNLLVSQAVAAHKAGQLQEAARLYRQCLEWDPHCLPALYYGGILALQQTPPVEAAKLFQTLSGLEPKRADVWYHLGLAQQRCGRNAEAERSYREALACNPRLGVAGNNLALLLRARGALGEAVAVLRAVVQADPERAEYWLNLGLALHEGGDVLDALNCYRRAERIEPDARGVILNLGRALSDSGDHAGAIQYLQRAIERFPEQAAKAYVNLGAVFDEMGDLEAAAEAYRSALAREPDNTHALLNLAKVLQAQAKFEAAIETFHMALALKPEFPWTHNSLGTALLDQGKLDDAVASFQKALALKPDLAEACNNLGNAFQLQGKLDEAIGSFQKALALKPEFAEARSNLLFLYSYRTFLDPHKYLARARGWEQACVPEQERQVARNRDFRRLPLAGRRLKVGYVSGDFRQHSVSYFIERLFAHHDRGRVELFAYSTHVREDAVTERLKALVDRWVPLRGIADNAARERIDADGIDVLVDLSGHTSDHRLGIFARRAAPVQAHYLGYFASTGLSQMDFWIGDGILTPAETDSHFSEQVWRLPRVWVSYAGDQGAPEPQWRPAEDGAVWIGSFNNIRKLTPATLALWARILQALPEGRLLLKTKELADTGNRQRVLDDMASQGIPSSRIELQDWSATPDWSAHMAYYNRLDIALDPVGAMGGGTTTCDALWMGVPVVTLAGDRMASRMGSTMLDAIGHPEWIARSEQEYIDKVVVLARSPEPRRQVRLSLRSEVAGSPLCDAKGLATALEDAYFAMFDRWQNRHE